MNNHYWVPARFLLAGLTVFALASCGAAVLLIPVQAEGPPEKPESPSGILVKECRIVLSDQIQLSCDRAGILKTIDVKEGDHVSANQRVALLADEVAAAMLAVAELKGNDDAEVRVKQKAAELAKTEYEKSSSAKIGVVAVLEVEKLRLNAAKAALEVELAKKENALSQLEAKKVKAELDTYSVLAKIEGTITQIYKKEGEAVRQGDPIAKLVNTERVRIEGKLKLAELKYAKKGGKVIVRLNLQKYRDNPKNNVNGLDFPEERLEFEGRILLVDPESDGVAHETKVIAEVHNPDNVLRAGLHADMYLQKE